MGKYTRLTALLLAVCLLLNTVAPAGAEGSSFQEELFSDATIQLSSEAEDTPAPTETTPVPTETTPAPTETTPVPAETTPVPA